MACNAAAAELLSQPNGNEGAGRALERARDVLRKVPDGDAEKVQLVDATGKMQSKLPRPLGKKSPSAGLRSPPRNSRVLPRASPAKSQQRSLAKSIPRQVPAPSASPSGSRSRVRAATEVLAKAGVEFGEDGSIEGDLSSIMKVSPLRIIMNI